MKAFVSGFDLGRKKVFDLFEVSDATRAAETTFKSFTSVLREKFPAATTLVISFSWEDEVRRLQ